MRCACGLLAICWLAGTAVAATDEPGWRAVTPRTAHYSTGELPTLAPLEPQGGEESSGTEGFAPMALGAGAAEVAPEISALASELGNDPERIFQFVRQKVEYQPYYGSAKGAVGTLLEGAGNAWDQSSLLIALLRAAGVTQVEYAVGAVFVRDWSQSGNDLEHWLGMRRELVPIAVFNSAGVLDAWDYGSHKLFLIEHVWVRAVIGGSTYHLDPSYQRSTPHDALDLATLSGFDAAQLRVDAGGVTSGDSVTNVDRAAVEQRLATFAATLRANLIDGHATASIEEIAGGSTRIASASPTLAGGGPLAEFSPGVFYYENELPASVAVNVRVRLGSQIDETLRVDELGGGRLTVAFGAGAGGVAELWHGDTLLASESTASGASVDLSIDMDHPGSQIQPGAALEWDASLGGRSLLRTGIYDITPAVFPYGPATGRQEASQALISTYIADGLATGSREMLGESLHLLGLQWVRQVALGTRLAANVREGFTVIAHVAGISGQEDGFFVDMPMVTGLAADATGMDGELFTAQIGLMSAFEHAVVEQMGAPRAVSTVKALTQANDEGQRVFRANSANWASVSAQLVNYPPGALSAMASGVAAGATLLVHENGALAMDDWTGFGYARLEPNSSRMLIAGGLSGGFSTVFLLIDGNLVAQRTFLDWLVDWRVLGTPEALSAEPVDLRTGSYLLRKTDLVLGQADSPRGLEFSRSYNSSRKGSGSLGLGWTHSCHGRIQLGNSPEAAFGLLRARDASPMLVATLAALEFADPSGPPKDLLLWVLAANWAADTTVQNTAFVELGDQRLVYSRNETGGWSRPAGTRTELEGSPGNLVLKPHLLGSIGFDAQNRIAFWDDPDGNRRTYTYDPEGRLATVEDSVGRTLAFNYVDAQSPLLSGVSDSTGRSIGFAYSGGLLASATDPENFTSTFGYDAAGRLDLWTDPTGAPIARNFYDSEGRVVAQHSLGDPAQEWTFTYRPGVTTETDPDGRTTTWLFDAQGRLGGIRDPLGNMPFVIYDTANRITQSYDARGYPTFFFFDSDDNLFARENTEGEVAWFGHDALGRPEWTQDETGRTTTFAWNAQNHLVSTTDPASRTTTFTYRPDGLPATRTEPGNRVTTYTYDAWGTPSGVQRPDGTSTSSTFNARGDLLTRTDARGHTTSFTYDKRRLLTSTTDPAGHTATFTHDANGYPVTATDRRGFTATTPTDNFGLVQSITPPDTGTSTFAYDARDLLVSTTNALNHTTLQERDAAGRIVRTEDALGRTTNALAYDPDGRPTAQTNGANDTTSFAYNALGQLTSRTTPASHATSYQYDQAGRRTELRNPRNEAFAFAHGPDGQQDSLTYPSGRQRVVLERDERGLPRILRSPSGRLITLGYDALGRLISHADDAGTITWTRDAEGNPTAITEGAATITRTFDALGRITSCTDTLGNTVGYGYDAEGNITTVTYPDGKAVTYSYDGAGRMRTVTDWAGRTTTYVYDAAGRLDRIERPNGTVGIYEWDAANRLTGQREMRGAVTLWRSAYGYDGANRLQRLDQIPPAPQVPVPAAAMTFDADNQLATINGQPVTGDADGNLLTAPLGDTTLGTLTWDARNRLTSATTSTGTTTTYGYDAEDRRISSTTAAATTTYTWSRGPLDRLLVKTNPDGSITRYIHGLGLLYEETTPAEGEPIAQFYHFNWQGSTMALSDPNGTITARIAYSPYGSHQVTFGTTDTPFLFNGQFGVMTEPNGLLTMMARFYSPTLCRFLSEDPVLFAGGDNFYAYAAGDPINLIDPFGLGPVGLSGWQQGLVNAANLIAGALEPFRMLMLSPGGPDTGFPGSGLRNLASINPNSFNPALTIVNEDLSLNYRGIGSVATGLFLTQVANTPARARAQSVPSTSRGVTQLEFGFVKNLENPNFVIFKGSEFNRSMLRPGEYTLNLPYLRNEALDWAQNQQALQRAMNIGNPIREVNPNALGGWLQRERDFMSSQWWQRISQGDDVLWVKPSGQ